MTHSAATATVSAARTPWSPTLLERMPRMAMHDGHLERLAGVVARQLGDLDLPTANPRLVRLDGDLRVTSLSASGRTAYLCVVVPETVVDHVHLADLDFDDDLKVVAARAAFEAAAHALSLPELPLDEANAVTFRCRTFAEDLMPLVSDALGRPLGDRTRITVRAPSPFGPAGCAIRSALAGRTARRAAGWTEIPDGLAALQGLRPCWAIGDGADAEQQASLCGILGVGDVHARRDPVDSMRFAALPGVDAIVQRLANIAQASGL